jgi:hypothetical protein
MSINKCPLGNLQSFPVKAGFTVTDTTFTQANQKPLDITFKWGTRRTAPNFSYATSGIIDHTQNENATSLMYNGVMYTLASVQLTAPSHNSWLTPRSLEVSKLDNNEDIMVTFQRDMYAPASETDPYIIILVNPILRNRSQDGNPLYLANMANQMASPVTLETIFPYASTNTYAYYTTCVNGITTQDPYKNILVLLNVNGMIVSDNLMIKIKDMYNKFSEGDYPTYVPPGNFNTRSNTKDSIKGLREGFQTASYYNPGAPNESSSVSGRYTVDKCVPFDPETQVDKDGVIVLNRDNGQPIKTVIDTRNMAKSDWKDVHKGVIPVSMVEQTFIYVVVGITGLVIVFGFLFFITNLSGASGGPGKNLGFFDVLLTASTSFLFPLAIFIMGFFVGMFTLPASCQDTEGASDYSKVLKDAGISTAVVLGIVVIILIYIIWDSWKKVSASGIVPT